MTRKEALQKAITYLRELKDESIQETIAELEQLISAVPITEWDLTTSLDAIDQFYLEHNRYPFSSEFKGSQLPSYGAIKHRYQVCVREFLQQNYPDSYRVDELENINKYRYQSADYWLDMFRKFMQDNPSVTSRTYDRTRDDNMPCMVTMLKIAGVKTWNELLVKAGLPVKKTTESIEYSVTLTLDKNAVKRRYVGKNLEEVQTVEKLLEWY